MQSITQQLEKECELVRKSQQAATTPQSSGTVQSEESSRLAAVFMVLSEPHDILGARLPSLITSMPAPKVDGTNLRLVHLKKASGQRLMESLDLQNVTSIALFDDLPQSSTLIDYVRTNVAPVGIEGRSVADLSTYLPLVVNTINTSAGSKQEAKRGSSKIEKQSLKPLAA